MKMKNAVQKSKHEQVKHVEYKTIIMNRFTGEIVDKIPEGSKPGEYRVQQDYSDVPSHTDQTQIDENNITKLMEKYKPDELAAYLSAKNANRQLIQDHDFSQEPDLMGAMNAAYQIQSEFDKLPEVIKLLFKGKPAEFLKFCENPKNRPQLEAWGIAKKAEEIVKKQEDPKKPEVSSEQPKEDAKK